MARLIFPDASTSPSFLATSEMVRLIDAYDWSSTVVGPISSWSPALIVTTRMMLANPVAMVMLMGPKGVLVYNDAYAVFAGGRHPRILGDEVAKGWPEIADFNERILAKVLAGETLSLKSQKLALNRNGVAEDAWLDLDYSPVLDSDGVPVAELVIVSEITERVKAEQALAKTNEKLSFTLAASGAVGTWDWDIQNDIVTCDRRFADMYGVPWDVASKGAPIGKFIEGVHPDDRAHLGDSIERAMRTGGSFDSEYRLQGKDGVVNWVIARGGAIMNEDGTAARLPGVVIDITERKRAEEALAASEAGFRVLADSMPQMVWSTGPDGFHDYYNARWYEYTGVASGSTDGEAWNSMFHPDDQEQALALWRHSLATGDLFQIEYRLRHRSGAYRWNLGRALPLRDAQGRIIRWYGTCTDIHDSKLAAEEREVVTQELSHRIKNIFAVLTGIIALSARAYPGMKPFADQLRERITAMGTAHDFVRPHSNASKGDETQYSLRALLEKLVAQFEADGQPRVSFSGDDAPIDDASASPVALVVHELATNAAKYGALSRTGGRVEITGSLQDADYSLRWREIGGPPIDAVPEAKGFGSRLIKLSAEGQLGGKLLQDWDRDGLDVTFVVPLASLNRSANVSQDAG